ALLTIAPAVPAQIDDAQFRKDLEAICSIGPRALGTDGYEKTAAVLREQIKAMPGVELAEQDYPVMAPVTGSAVLSLPGGRGEKVYPFWPAGVRLCATPPEGITGKLVYCGRAGFDEIRPAELA